MKTTNMIYWEKYYQELNDQGFACIPEVLSSDECIAISKAYHQPSLFRTTINMQRYRFGRGEYKYLNYPLPEIIERLREYFYKPLSLIANQWMKQLAMSHEYPDDLNKFIAICREQGQVRPTPLILRYEAGGYNTLHQDLYGKIYFPFQVVIVLTQHGKDHEGGELVFTEQIPRAQSKVQVVVPNAGDAIVFTTNFRPVKGTRGYYRANMKHGVSKVRSGIRYALGIIFHDAA